MNLRERPERTRGLSWPNDGAETEKARGDDAVKNRQVQGAARAVAEDEAMVLRANGASREVLMVRKG